MKKSILIIALSALSLLSCSQGHFPENEAMSKFESVGTLEQELAYRSNLGVRWNSNEGGGWLAPSCDDNNPNHHCLLPWDPTSIDMILPTQDGELDDILAIPNALEVSVNEVSSFSNQPNGAMQIQIKNDVDLGWDPSSTSMPFYRVAHVACHRGVSGTVQINGDGAQFTSCWRQVIEIDTDAITEWATVHEPTIANGQPANVRVENALVTVGRWAVQQARGNASARSNRAVRPNGERRVGWYLLGHVNDVSGFGYLYPRLSLCESDAMYTMVSTNDYTQVTSVSRPECTD